MKKRNITPQKGFFPQPMYLIGTYKENGKPNFSLITWFTFCCANPPIVMMSLHGKKKTIDMINKTNIFSANVVTKDIISIADNVAMSSGYDINKCDRYDIKTLKGNHLNVPILEESPWVFECEVIDTKVIEDNTVYFAKVKNIQCDENIDDISYGNINLRDIKPTIYAPGNYYGVSDVIEKVGFTKK